MMRVVPTLADKMRRPTCDRLFRYDLRIVASETRAAFSGWLDRLAAAIVLLMGLAAMRSWFADRPWMIAAWAGLGAGAIVGLTAGRLVAARLAFHAADGPLAADALRRPTRRRYMISWHTIALALVAVVLLVARPSMLIFSLPGYLVGTLAGHGTGDLAVAVLFTGKTTFARSIRSWMQHPPAGLLCAAILLLSLALPARMLGAPGLSVLAGIAATLLALALTTVDDEIVRFMTITGHGSWRIVARRMRGVMLFAGAAAPACMLAFGTLVAGIVAAASTAALLLMTIRILAYRLYGKRFAEFLVLMLVAAIAFVAFSMPVILPLVAIAIPWQLHRRAVAKTWLLA